MDVSHYQHTESIVIERPPDAVYGIVSDVTRVGELSPVCASATWDDPATAGTVGAWFTGHNVLGDALTWDTRCEVVEAEQGRAFAWVNHGVEGKRNLVRWGYELEPEGAGTRVTETWQVLPEYPEFVLADNPDADVAASIDGMADMARSGISDTLASLKRVAEA